jgi:zinc-finger of transposase IS204/IS1001/IS1096/IS1165
VLLPHLAGVLVERVFTAGRSVRVRARACGPAAACQQCGALSRRVHSRYERRLLDTAAGGQEVMICLSVRRFFCPDAGCAKVTFAEQVPGLTSAHARRSPGLTGVLRAIALAAGGRGAAVGTVSGQGEPDDADPADPCPARSRVSRGAAGAGGR